MKTKLIGILTLTALLYACDGSELDIKIEEDTKPAEEVKTPVKEEVKEEVKATVNDILDIYKKTLIGQFSVVYNDKENIFVFLPTNDTFNRDLMDMMNERLPLTEWYKVVDGMRGLSLSTEETLGSGYGHAIVNPFNTENIILLVKDGTVLLDAFEGRE